VHTLIISTRLAFSCAEKTCERICRTDKQIVSENILGHDGTLLDSEQLAVKMKVDRHWREHSRIFWFMAALKQPAEPEET